MPPRCTISCLCLLLASTRATLSPGRSKVLKVQTARLHGGKAAKATRTHGSRKTTSIARDDTPVARGGAASVSRAARAASTSIARSYARLSDGRAPRRYGWAVFHNWLYFLSLGLCIPVLPKVIASAVNDGGAAVITPRSARVAGDVEGLDKLLTRGTASLFEGRGAAPRPF